MKVACINCAKKFVLPDAALRPGGIPVQCGSCGQLFTAFHPQDPQAPAPTQHRVAPASDPNATTQPGPPTESASQATAGPGESDRQGAVAKTRLAAPSKQGLPPAQSSVASDRRPKLEIVESPGPPAQVAARGPNVAASDVDTPHFPTPPPTEPPAPAPAPHGARASHALPASASNGAAPLATDAPAQREAEPSAAVGAAGATADPMPAESIGLSIQEQAQALAGWAPNEAATSGVYESPASEGEEDPFLLDELYQDPFVATRRRRRKAIVGFFGLVVAGGGLLALLYVASPATFDNLVGKRFGIRAAWDEQAVALVAKGHAQLALDDRASLDAALLTLNEAYLLDPEYPQAVAELAAGHFLLAATIRQAGKGVIREASALSDRASKLTVRMKRLHGAAFKSQKQKLAPLITSIQSINKRSAELFESAGKIGKMGYELTTGFLATHPNSAPVMCALLLYYGFEDDAGSVATLGKNVRGLGEAPALCLLGEGFSDLNGDPEVARRSRALASFEASLKADPTLLRARLGKARALLDLGRVEEAGAEVAAIKAANPAHLGLAIGRPD